MVPDPYDKLMSYVRTFWPLILGHLAALLVVAVARTTGIHLDNAFAYEVVGVVMTAALYAGARWLEHRTGDTLPARAARIVGQLLLSLGLPVGPPTYTTPPPTPYRE